MHFDRKSMHLCMMSRCLRTHPPCDPHPPRPCGCWDKGYMMPKLPAAALTQNGHMSSCSCTVFHCTGGQQLHHKTLPRRVPCDALLPHVIEPRQRFLHACEPVVEVVGLLVLPVLHHARRQRIPHQLAVAEELRCHGARVLFALEVVLDDVQGDVDAAIIQPVRCTPVACTHLHRRPCCWCRCWLGWRVCSLPAGPGAPCRCGRCG
mmetsp:Transcript_8917/g.22056  ORF Transcript_8917/g.22056 Transcript_8917/m.22056 type:complete len:206 (-) Transcript_8917:7-624(-)